MAGHTHIRKAEYWDMSPKDQITAMTQGRPRAPEPQERMKMISRHLLEGQPIATEQSTY